MRVLGIIKFLAMAIHAGVLQYRCRIKTIAMTDRALQLDLMMTMGGLWERVELGKAEATAELNRRSLVPSTIMILFFFAQPLSLTRKRSGKAGSLISGIALLVLIYNAQLLLHRQVSQGDFPGWSMWAAQIVMLVMAIYLWRRAEADRMPKLFPLAGEWTYFLRQWIMHRVAHRWSQP